MAVAFSRKKKYAIVQLEIEVGRVPLDIRKQFTCVASEYGVLDSVLIVIDGKITILLKPSALLAAD